MALETLYEEAKLFKPQIFWNIARCRYLKDSWMMQNSVHGCDEESEILENFTHICTVVQSSGGCGHEVSRRRDFFQVVMSLLVTSVGYCRYLRWP